MVDKYNKMSDETLIECAQAEDKHAFDIIVTRYQTRVAGLISRYIWDRNEVADVTQEIFLRAYCALSQFRGESTFSTWLYRITINYLKNVFLLQKRRVHTLSVDIEYLEQRIGRTLLKDDASPEQIMLYEQAHQVINDLINQLGNDVKMAFILREMEGLSYEDIADILQCPLGTVRSRIYRAREAMEAALEEILQDE